MTDKEMAVNWTKENAGSCKSGNMNAYEFAEQAFLAGLKAGRPKWHKVADGDLPPEGSIVLALMVPNEICIAYFYRKNMWDKIGTVFAWCDIPEYTEE